MPTGEPPHRPVRDSGIRDWRWFGPRETIKIGDLRIAAPMVYITDSRHVDGCAEPAAIDIAQPIASNGLHSGSRELDYWPRYDALTPQQRRNYLDWLAAGRTQIPAELGYTFLFIYGLERRTLCEQDDQAEVFDEVLRLRKLYIDTGEAVSRSFDGYTSSFLWFLAAIFPQKIGGKQIEQLAATVQVWTEANLISMASWFAQVGAPLPPWAGYVIAESLPTSQRSVVVRRVGEQLRELFASKYHSRFGAGLMPIASKRPLRHQYKAASSVIQSAEVIIPNPFGAPSQFKALSEIWNQCLQELKRLSSVVAKTGTAEELSPDAWEALPLELRARTDHPLSDRLQELVEKNTREDGRVLVRVSQVAQALTIGNGIKLTPTQSKRICQTAAYAGYALEPDARASGKGYRDDQVVTMFLRTSDEEVDPIRYNAAACMLRVGMVIAAADGEIHQQEIAVLMQQVRQAFELSALEERRLEALRGLLEQCPPDWASLTRMAKSMNSTQREATGKLMLALVAADGVVTDDELKAVRKGYAVLGLSRDEAEAAVAALSVNAEQSEEIPTVVPSAGAAQPGETIPQPTPVGLRLNRAAIAAIMSDTQEVAKMLAAAMQAEPDDQPKPSTPSTGPAVASAVTTSLPRDNVVQVDAAVVAAAVGPDVTTIDDPTLPARYAAFYRLLMAKVRWELKEAESLARGQGHMLSGAIEALNDWAFEKYGGQLFVEEGDNLLIEKELLN